MRVTLSGLVLAASAVFAVLVSPVVGSSNGSTHKRHGHRHGHRHKHRGGRRGYFRNAYPPSVYYGQRFQFLYQCSPDFQKYWNSDVLFRRKWNTDLIFRNAWFASLYPTGLPQYRVGGIYYGYLGRTRWGRKRHGGRWSGKGHHG
ncbi:hypothetical protein AYI69_g7955 [Smittium culicis]|uniref:Uncharacterized protein n=1 Tax=Smittium culicis TaxID=133412 RepID=A0A1R1XNA7_9FUNG|nr:hypothetical protein AYI69_g7955 [Smittium culicis]